MNRASSAWPNLPYAAWKDTYATLHLWTQIVGKIRLAQTPWLNHSWHVVLYVSPRGLTTSSIPYGDRSFELKFDFLNHALVATADDGSIRKVGLYPRSVADLYAEVIQSLEELGIEVRIHDMPNELPDPIRFNEDNTHASYDRDFAERHWRILAEVERVLFKFRTSFLGKCSPVHFFWGSFDLAVTRFSGRRALERPGADPITRESYSHEVISHGFWPGSGAMPNPAFYAYAAPEPAGLKTASVRPSAASYSSDFSEFLLPYEAVRTANSPEADLTAFFTSTYNAAADLAKWNRIELERS
jgi:hypothetical protein